MLTITLKPDMAEQVNQLASETQSDAATVVDKALRNYLTESRHKKISAEHAEFDRQRPELLNRYRGLVIVDVSNPDAPYFGRR